MTSITIRTKSLSDIGELQRLTFTVPENGGYVCQIMPDGTHRQVCTGLAFHGATLMSSGRFLAEDIRRELRRLQRALRRDDTWGVRLTRTRR